MNELLGPVARIFSAPIFSVKVDEDGVHVKKGSERGGSFVAHVRPTDVRGKFLLMTTSSWGSRKVETPLPLSMCLDRLEQVARIT